MAASIVRLEQENDELRAEVALLREEQKILAKGFPSPPKAAVIEGVEQQDLPAGLSRIGCHERPEPSPELSDTPETDEAVERWRQGKINIFDEMERLERERDEARDAVLKLRRERAAQDGVIESMRDQLCADKCRDKAAADGNWTNI